MDILICPFSGIIGIFTNKMTIKLANKLSLQINKF